MIVAKPGPLRDGIQALKCEKQDMDKAMAYQWYVVLMDLASVEQNVSNGCSIVAMSGTGKDLAYGFTRMRDYNGHLTFQPRLPKELKAPRPPLSIKSRALDVATNSESATYTLRVGPELVVSHWGEKVTLAEDVPISTLSFYSLPSSA